MDEEVSVLLLRLLMMQETSEEVRLTGLQLVQELIRISTVK
jgi:hypothetical protein